MPIFRGIEISVVASAQARNLPEYPHPDGSSVCLMPPDALRMGNPQSPQPSESSILSEGNTTRQKKVHPRISVYIPSMPGEQFWLKYNIIRPPAPATHLYFKIYMNGALITSWGIPVDVDKADQNGQRQSPISGTVVKALYKPGERWQSMSTDAEGRMVGIETRYFHFMSGLEEKSIADDGGLIEIQVFRSKGRRRRAPKMMEFRTQERYGIASPSGGLVENPQDATCYDWLLIDPKNAPYASFRFHYRSMKYLLQLNLVPQAESKSLLSEPDSCLSIEPGSPVSGSKTPDARSPSTPHFNFGPGPESTPVFNDESPGHYDRTTEDDIFGRHSLKPPLELFPAIPAALPSHQQPDKAHRDSLAGGSVHRPLPNPPQPRSRHASQSSVHSIRSLHSTCPSLTPSLANYVNGGDFGDDEISIGTAHTVMCSLPSMVELPHRGSALGEGDSMSDYERSPPSSISSPFQDLPPPERYVSTTGSTLESQFAQFTSPSISHSSPRRLRARFPTSVSDNTLFGNCAVSSPGNLSLSESEWMRRTPSPVERKGLSRLWSPRLGKKLTGLTPKDKKHNSWYSNFGHYSSNESLDNSEEVQKRSHAQNTVGSSDRETSEDATTPRATSFSENSQRKFNPNASKESSYQHVTWESCRELSGCEQEAVERPVGNWI